jgi:predicted amidophosphoribosyltransferase
MFCSKCGAQAAASAKFCEKCGNPLAAGASAPRQPPPVPVAPVTSGTMRGMGKSQVTALALSLVRKVRNAVGH